MKQRIKGIDVARALAVIGMIIVNFKLAFGSTGSTYVSFIASLFEGKASATFVVLAGIGIALMSNSAVQNKEVKKINSAKRSVAKKAIFLFIIGLAFTPIWIADILHFYGVYMLIAMLFLNKSNRSIFFAALMLVLIYPFLMMIWEYDTGWNFNTFSYADFWSFTGFTRNLFFNGFHPVIPWTAFMLIGLWFGKHNLNDTEFIKKSMKVSLLVFNTTLLVSKSLILVLSNGDQSLTVELNQLLGTSPMPPLPIYMIAGSSFALFVISLCIYLAKRYKDNVVVDALHKTGKLALTFYMAHVIIGMGLVEFLNPANMGNYSIEFSVGYAAIFSLSCIVFAVVWLKYYKIGPLEFIIRKLSN